MFKKKYKSTVRVGGIGTFWKGYEIDNGTFRFGWVAWIYAKLYVIQYPHREVTISKI